MSSKNNPVHRSLLSENIAVNKGFSNNSKHKNLLLRSFDSSVLQSHDVPIEETLENALVDLYLSVKIRSNEEVSLLINNFRLTIMTTKNLKKKGKSSLKLIRLPYCNTLRHQLRFLWIWRLKNTNNRPI